MEDGRLAVNPAGPGGQALEVVGRSVPPVDGAEKVTGRAEFAVDVAMRGMLYGKILRSGKAAPSGEGVVRRGMGMACVVHVNGNRSVFRPFEGSSARVRLDEDGVARVMSSCGDIGLGAFASRVTVMAGNAVKKAAERVREELLGSPEDVVLADRHSKYGHVSPTYSLRAVAAYDGGRIINPLLARGQVEGGILQGLGFRPRRTANGDRRESGQSGFFRLQGTPGPGRSGPHVSVLRGQSRPGGSF